MDSVAEIRSLLKRVRDGDQEAAAELVRQYEPVVRRFVRFRLSSPALRRTFDSLDICQSVMCRFFVDVAAGNLQLDDSGQLTGLLLTMARNKLFDRVRHAQAGRRDARRTSGGGDEFLGAAVDSTASPSDVLSAKEVIDAVCGQLSESDRYLVEQRMDGRPWEDLAAEFQATPDGIRKRMTRAIDDVAGRMGLREG